MLQSNWDFNTHLVALVRTYTLLNAFHAHEAIRTYLPSGDHALRNLLINFTLGQSWNKCFSLFFKSEISPFLQEHPICFPVFFSDEDRFFIGGIGENITWSNKYQLMQ